MSRREHNIQPLLPSGYRELEYIGATGTQYINPNISVNTGKTEYIIRYSKTYVTSGGYSLIGGGDTNDTHWTGNCYHSGMQLRFYVGTSGNVFSYNLTANEIYDLNVIVNANNIMYSISIADQSRSGSFNDNLSTFQPWIFTFNRGGTKLYNFRGKLYRLAIIRNDVYERYFIPALRIADNKPGLYDLANNQFYTNAGTGEFLYA